MSKPVVIIYTADASKLKAVNRAALADVAATEAGIVNAGKVGGAGMAAGIASGSAKARAAMTSIAVRGAAVSREVSALGRQMTHAFTVPVVAIGAASVKLAVDFTTALGRVEGLVGISHKQVMAWGDQILKMGKTLPQAPTELANALFFVTSAGFRGKDAMDVLTASARAAAAGLGDTHTIADAVTSAVNAYGLKTLSAAKATDIMTNTVVQGKMEATSLAGAIGRVISPANAVGVSFDQVGAAIASMTRLGLNAEESTTALRGILMATIKPTKGQADALTAMGLSLKDVQSVIKTQGLLPALELLATRAHGNTGALAALIPNVRALNGFLALTGKNVKSTDGVFAKLKDSVGATSRAFLVHSQTAGFKLQQSLSSLKAVAIQLGITLLPMVVKAAAGVVHLAQAFQHLSPHTRKLIEEIAAIVAVVGPVLWIFGKLGEMTFKIFKILRVLTVAVELLVPALGLLLTPVGLVVAAVAALGAGLYFAYTRSATFRKIVHEAFHAVAQAAGVVRTAVVDAAMAMVHWFEHLWNSTQHLRTTIEHAFKQIADIVSTAVQIVVQTIRDLVNAFTWIWKNIAIVRMMAKLYWNMIVTDVKVAFGIIKDSIKFAWNAITTVFKVALDVIKGVLKFAWNAVKTEVKVAWDLVKGIIKVAFDEISGVFHAALDILQGKWGKAWNTIKAIPGKVLHDGLGAIKSAIGDIANGIITACKDFGKLLWDAGKHLVEGLVGGIKDMAMAPVHAIEGIGKGIYHGVTSFFGIKSPSRLMHELGMNIGQGLANGIIASTPLVAAAAQGMHAVVLPPDPGTGATYDRLTSKKHTGHTGHGHKPKVSHVVEEHMLQGLSDAMRGVSEKITDAFRNGLKGTSGAKLHGAIADTLHRALGVESSLMGDHNATAGERRTAALDVHSLRRKDNDLTFRLTHHKLRAPKINHTVEQGLLQSLHDTMRGTSEHITDTLAKGNPSKSVADALRKSVQDTMTQAVGVRNQLGADGNATAGEKRTAANDVHSIARKAVELSRRLAHDATAAHKKADALAKKVAKQLKGTVKGTHHKGTSTTAVTDTGLPGDTTPAGGSTGTSDLAAVMSELITAVKDLTSAIGRVTSGSGGSGLLSSAGAGVGSIMSSGYQWMQTNAGGTPGYGQPVSTSSPSDTSGSLPDRTANVGDPGVVDAPAYNPDEITGMADVSPGMGVTPGVSVAKRGIPKKVLGRTPGPGKHNNAGIHVHGDLNIHAPHIKHPHEVAHEVHWHGKSRGR